MLNGFEVKDEVLSPLRGAFADYTTSRSQHALLYATNRSEKLFAGIIPVISCAVMVLVPLARESRQSRRFEM